MRGRTNIPPRKAPRVNGDLRNFVVSNGNTIVKGDFVSYVLNNNYVQFDTRNLVLKFKQEYDETNHKFVLVFSIPNSTDTLVVLAQVINGDLITLDSSSSEITNSFGGACVENGYLYLCDAPSSAITTLSVPIYIKKYDISNNELDLSQTYTQSFSLNSGIQGTVLDLSVSGTTFYISLKKRYTGSQSTTLCVIYGELGGSITDNNKIFNDLASNVASAPCFVDSYTVGSYILFVSSLSYSNSKKVTIYAMDTSTKNFTLQQSYSGEIAFCSDRFGSRFCLVETNKLKFFSFESGTYTLLYNESKTFTSSAIVGRIGQNKYVVMITDSPYTTSEFIFGETIEKIDNTLNTVVANIVNSLHCVLSDYTTHVLVDCSQSNGVVKYYGGESNQGFVLGQPTNFVQSYTGGYVVGFANTGGTAGQTIQVYVPHSNS